MKNAEEGLKQYALSKNVIEKSSLCDYHIGIGLFTTSSSFSVC